MKKTNSIFCLFFASMLLTPLQGVCSNDSNNKSNVHNLYHDGWIDFNKNGIKDIYEDIHQPIDKRVENLVSQMTIEEKSCQLATLYGFGRVLKDSLPTPAWEHAIWKDGIANIDEQLNGVGSGYKRAYHLIYPYSSHVEAIHTTQRWFVEQTRLGIPVDFSNEGIHGLNHTLATPLPAPISIGSTWNRALVKRAGEIVGKEGKLLGYTNIYAPILDIARDPRWGRTPECYGEAPFLIAELGSAMTSGIQKSGIGATLKHYAVYSAPEGGRDGSARTNPQVTPREMHEIYLYPFKEVIKHSKPMGVMSSYNDWDGVPVSASKYFLTKLLREEYGFDGYVVSDSEAVEFVYTKHKVAEDYDDAVRQVLEAGLNVRTHFTHPEVFISAVRRLIAANKISMATIDQRVSEVLRVKFRLGLFDNPYRGNAEEADKIVGMERNLSFIDSIQQQSLVLLKNDDELLPLNKKKIKKVLVTGPLADEDNFMISRYGPNGLPTTTVLKGLTDYLKDDVEVIYRKGCDVVDENWPESEIIATPLSSTEQQQMEDAICAAQDVDVIIAVMGEDEFRVGESRSRTSLDLPGRQSEFLARLKATNKPIVLVLINGRPLTINWESQNIPAILECWFPSARGGIAIANTLFGEYNPGGKLTVTFPKSIGQIQYNFPFKKGSHGTQPPSGDPNGSGKTRVTGSLYPFGHGLSYTTFEYADLKVESPTHNVKDEVSVSCKITNTGTRAGDEVVQLYVSDLVSSVVTYESRLRGFERINLAPGESKIVTFTLTPQHLQLMDQEMKWNVEAGEFEVRIGGSSEDIRLRERFTLHD